jgi:hypothetical protein
MIYLLVLAVNILLLFFLRSEKKYWLVPISIWILMFSFFIVCLKSFFWQFQNNPEGAYADQDRLSTFFVEHSTTFIYCIVLQTFLTFIVQIIGYKMTTTKTIYKWTGVIFLLLLILIGMIELILPKLLSRFIS